MSKPRVIIAGAGPVGVVSALACAQHGFAVTLLEAEDKIDDNPRAATTHPSTLEMIARVGLIDPFIEEGLVARYFQFWDKPARRKIVEFDHDLLRDETPILSWFKPSSTNPRAWASNGSRLFPMRSCASRPG